jgi:hypothetical protein
VNLFVEDDPRDGIQEWLPALQSVVEGIDPDMTLKGELPRGKEMEVWEMRSTGRVKMRIDNKMNLRKIDLEW